MPDQETNHGIKAEYEQILTAQRRLPDLWWLQGQHYFPHAYTAPLLMTLSIWIERYLGDRDAFWRRGLQDANGVWTTPCRVVQEVSPGGSHRELHCRFPRWLILKEADFWNSPLGGKLRGPYIDWRFER